MTVSANAAQCDSASTDIKVWDTTTNTLYMDGLHDMGGRQGLGVVRYAANAPVCYAEWERRANALNGRAVRYDIFNMDEYLQAVERMSP